MKKIDKIRQWGSEKLGSQKQTTASDDFLALEKDVELRRQGVENMYDSVGAYSRVFGKKRDGTEMGMDANSGKILPVEAVGSVMVTHSDEFGNRSAFGQSLRSFGEAHLKIAHFQSIYVSELNENFLSHLERSKASISDFQSQRKKLEGRRLAYDAALAKVQKSKTEKRGLEEELRGAKAKYEETSDDVQSRALAIQEGEIEQMRELTGFLDAEIAFVTEWKKILDRLKAGWLDESAITRIEPPKPKGHAHTFSNPSNAGSVSRMSRRSSKRSVRTEDDEGDSDGSAEEEVETTPKRSGSRNDKTRSRSSSVLSGISSRGGDKDRDREREKEKEKDSAIKRNGSVPGFGKLASLTGVGSNKLSREDYQTFQSEDDDEEEEDGDLVEGRKLPPRFTSSPASSVPPNLPGLAANTALNKRPPPPPPSFRRTQTAPPSTPQAKVVRAKWDYEPKASDELDLRVGDRIVIVKEVNEEWWVGEREGDGKLGMFPANFTEIVEDGSGSGVVGGSGVGFGGKRPPPPPVPSNRRSTTPISTNTNGAAAAVRRSSLSVSVSASNGPTAATKLANSSSPFGDPSSVSAVPRQLGSLLNGGGAGKRPVGEEGDRLIRDDDDDDDDNDDFGVGVGGGKGRETFGSVNALKKKLFMN